MAERKRGQPKGKRALLTDDNFEVAKLAGQLGFTLHRLAGELGLNPGSSWYWNRGCRRPGSPETSPLEPFIPPSSLEKVKTFLQKVMEDRARSVQSAEHLFTGVTPSAE